MVPSWLFLEDGTSMKGYSPEWQQGSFFGEVVFTTGMTGYVESLTDPSYAGQILAFTYPLIGNYGVSDRKHWESHRIFARGVIVSEAAKKASHYNCVLPFLEWLSSQGVPLISGVDTRKLTIDLRAAGVKLGVITSSSTAPKHFENPNQDDLVNLVSVKQRHIFQNNATATKKVILVDCGVKQNIIRSLLQFPLIVEQVPHDTDYSNEPFDGVIVSNGPGDPKRCEKTIAVLKKAMLRKKPIFGICLGAQLLALAAGAKTYKLPFGHRGQNQPCKDLRTGKCYITSQNHGYAIQEDSLPVGWEVAFSNLNDGSVEGIRHSTLPFYAVQFHPEAAPGPTDTQCFFHQFYQSFSHEI